MIYCWVLIGACAYNGLTSQTDFFSDPFVCVSLNKLTRVLKLIVHFLQTAFAILSKELDQIWSVLLCIPIRDLDLNLRYLHVWIDYVFNYILLTFDIIIRLLEGDRVIGIVEVDLMLGLTKMGRFLRGISNLYVEGFTISIRILLEMTHSISVTLGKSNLISSSKLMMHFDDLCCTSFLQK